MSKQIRFGLSAGPKSSSVGRLSCDVSELRDALRLLRSKGIDAHATNLRSSYGTGNTGFIEFDIGETRQGQLTFLRSLGLDVEYD